MDRTPEFLDVICPCCDNEIEIGYSDMTGDSAERLIAEVHKTADLSEEIIGRVLEKIKTITHECWDKNPCCADCDFGIGEYPNDSCVFDGCGDNWDIKKISKHLADKEQ